MNTGSTLFSQLISLCTKYDFNTCVDKYRNGYQARKFSYWDQFLCMSFAQVTRRQSLRDIETCLRSAGSKTYHLGIRGKVSRNTLAKANEDRDYRIFAEYAQILMKEAQQYYATDGFGVELEQAVFAFDSTNIDLCLSLFPWAQFDSKRAGLRVCSLLNLRGNIPSFMHITTAKVSELMGMDNLPIEPGAMYIFDRGYFDWKRLGKFSNHLAHFVIRAKRDLKYRRLHSLAVDKTTGVRSDQIITPFSDQAKKNFPQVLRRITYVDALTNKKFVFLTNNLILSPLTIAALYKSRWNIELFFKWIKQHLHIQVFFGCSPNAVKIQIWTAISTFLLIAIAKKRFNLNNSFYTISQVLSLLALHKIPMKEALSSFTQQNIPQSSDNSSNQLDLLGFPTGH